MQMKVIILLIYGRVAAKQFLVKGTRWRFGGGAAIEVSKDLWIRDDNNFSLTSFERYGRYEGECFGIKI